MLMSIRSAPRSATIAAATRIASGSWPNSWIAIGCSSGWIRRNSRWVRSSPYFRPKLDTISETTRPAPWRFACRRTNQLPMPASGASTRRFGIRCPPSIQLSVRARMSLLRLAPVALPDDAQAVQREHVVHLVDLLAEGRDHVRVAAGRDGRGLVAQLLADAGEDAVDAAGEAVDDPGLDRGQRAVP